MAREEEIIEFIKEDLLDDPDEEVTLETSLFEERLLDSLNLIALISFLEKKHSIKINPSEVNVDNLDTVLRIISFLDKKQAG